MKLTSTKILSILMIVILYSCHRRLERISYFQTDPFAKPVKSKIDHSLHIVLLEGVVDSFVMDNNLGKVYVTQFRKTVSNSLNTTFKKNLPLVLTHDQTIDTGLVLVIYRIKPYWRTDSESRSTYTVDNVSSTSNFYALSSIFQLESSLFLNSEKIADIDLVVSSNSQMDMSKKAGNVFKDGLTNLCEAINKEVFKPEILQKIKQ